MLPLNGSREGLFSAIFPALGAQARDQEADGAHSQSVLPSLCGRRGSIGRRASSSCQAPLTRDFLPDLEAIDEALLERTVALYLCSPSNPQGAVAGHAYLARAIALARRFDFLLFADECYSEIYSDMPPPGALETAFAETGSFANVVAFNSLSKRSGLPGLRSGFVAGDPDFIARLRPFPQRRLPASAAPGTACLGRRLGRRRPCREGPRALRREFRPCRCPAWRAATATGGRQEASFFG